VGWIDVHQHILPPRFVAECREDLLYDSRDPAVLDWTPTAALTRWPGIAWIFSHGGGAVAVLAQRIVALAAKTGTIPDPLNAIATTNARTLLPHHTPA
jgi:hypothetical protein